MVIAAGESWGDAVPRPDGLRVVADDRALAAQIDADADHALAVSSGDMFRTVGARPLGDRAELVRLPIDVVDIELDGGVTHTAVAHVVARRPWASGGWWRGQVLAVMNAEYIGPFDVAPRGHPNDGRVETLLIAASMSMRQRSEVRRRLRNASHLPHPLITTRPVRTHEWVFESAMVIVVDGAPVGRSSSLAVTVRADAAVLYA